MKNTADTLATKVADHADWDARVRTAQGRDIPASNVPWMRTCEVWLHAVDLKTGVTVGDFPAEVIDALLDETVTWFGNHGGPPLHLAPTDRDRVWTVGAASEPTVGTAAELLSWLSGRDDGTSLDGPTPQVPPWR